MKLTDKRRRFVFVAVFALLCLLWIARFVYINAVWPRAEEIRIPVGQSVSVGNLRICVKDSLIDTQENVLSFYKATPSDRFPSLIEAMEKQGWQAKVLTAEIEFENVSDEPLELDLTALTAEQKQWSNGADSALYYALNPHLEERLTLAPREKIAAKISYDLFDHHFSADRWKAVETLPFSTALSLYPQKVMLMLNESI